MSAAAAMSPPTERNYPMAYKLRVYVPADEHEAAAKFAYFRKTEATIDVGPESVEPVKPKRVRPPVATPRRAPECGTYSGWSLHKREGTEPDQGCKDAAAAYMRVYRATLRNMRDAA
jgi:hypothetical protein